MVVNQNLEREFLLRREIAHLTDEFEGPFGPETVERFVRESLDDLEAVRVKDFIPNFVRRFSRERPRAPAQVEGNRHQDWELEDPAGQPPEKAREIRDAVALRVELLLAELGIPRVDEGK